VTRQLAEIIAAMQPGDLPPEVVTVAGQVMLDAAANMLAGSREPMAGTVLRALTSIEPAPPGGGHTVIGHSVRLPLLAAAFANGVFGHCMDFEMMWLPLTHPTSPVVPSFLALSELQPVTGAELALAIAASFEVQGRLRLATVAGGIPHLWGPHPPGVVGVIGSAAGCARLLGLSAEQTAMAMSMACSRAGGLMVNTGTMTKAMHSGNAARMGLEAALLVAAGCTASTTGIEGTHGLNEVVYGGQMVLEPVAAGFGRPFRMVDPGLAMKRFPSQYPTHWSIEAALTLRAAHDLRPEDIAAVEIEVGANNESARRAWPVSGLEGKFCTAYTVACALLDGQVTIGTFRDERLSRPDLAELRPKITVSFNPDIDSMNFPLARSTVRVRTTGGQLLEQEVTRPSGIWSNPVTEQQRTEKFAMCAAVAEVPEPVAAALAERLLRVSAEPDVAALVRDLAPAAGAGP
jgi:2-methylcitrate dehydratase PrpD